MLKAQFILLALINNADANQIKKGAVNARIEQTLFGDYMVLSLNFARYQRKKPAKVNLIDVLYSKELEVLLAKQGYKLDLNRLRSTKGKPWRLTVPFSPLGAALFDYDFLMGS